MHCSGLYQAYRAATNASVRATRESGRSLGVLITAVLVCLSAFWFTGGNSKLWLVGALGASLFSFVTIFSPRLLNPAQRLWIAFGNQLGRLTGPLALLIFFFVVLVPLGVVCRLFGRDELGLRKEKRSTFWSPRQPAVTSSLKDQF